MRLPIQYAVTYPIRHPSPATAPDLVAAARLDFRAPDEARFPALRIAREAGRIGSRATTALIAADEVAVGAVPRRQPRLPGHRPDPRDAPSRGSGPDRTSPRRSTSSSRSTPRSGLRSSAERSPDGPVRAPDRHHDRHLLRDARDPRRHPRARPLRDRPAGRRPGPRVRDRLPAAGEGPPLGRRDALHAELAADRRVRPARGRGRRLGRPALVRPGATADEARDPHRRRRDEPRPGVRDLLRDLRLRLSDLDADDQRGPA